MRCRELTIQKKPFEVKTVVFTNTNRYAMNAEASIVEFEALLPYVPTSTGDKDFDIVEHAALNYLKHLHIDGVSRRERIVIINTPEYFKTGVNKGIVPKKGFIVVNVTLKTEEPFKASTVPEHITNTVLQALEHIWKFIGNKSCLTCVDLPG